VASHPFSFVFFFFGGDGIRFVGCIEPPFSTPVGLSLIQNHRKRVGMKLESRGCQLRERALILFLKN